eukprot:4249515-Amphidinium_carterae.1
MFVYYYQKTRQKDKPTHEQRFVTFMIDFYYNKAQVIMARAKCTPQEISDAYEFYNRGTLANDRIHLQVQPSNHHYRNTQN